MKAKKDRNTSNSLKSFWEFSSEPRYLKSCDPYQTIALIEGYLNGIGCGTASPNLQVAAPSVTNRRGWPAIGRVPPHLTEHAIQIQDDAHQLLEYIDYPARPVKNVPVDVFRTYVGSTRKLALATLEQSSSGELLAAPKYEPSTQLAMAQV